MKKNSISIEKEILDFFKNNNFEKSRRFMPNAYSPKHLRESLKKLKNPQFDYKTIHVAGTSGKGSLVRYLSRLIQKQKVKTASYLSPHLMAINERFLINDAPVSDNLLEKAWHEIRPLTVNFQLSFFDALTAMAFYIFKHESVDYAVIETGLGGRLDSTNNLKPLFCVIAPIGLDHVNILGNSLKKIAREKAGIIKKNGVVYSMPQEDEAAEVLFRYAKKQNAKLSFVKIPEKLNFIEKNIFAADYIYQDFFSKPPHKIKKELPGIFEILNKKPLLIFDSAHNSVSSFELGLLLKERYPDKKIQIYINMMKERSLQNFLTSLIQEKLNLNISSIILLPAGDNFYSKDEFYNMQHKLNIPFSHINKFSQIIDFLEEQKDALHLVTGSLYLYKETVDVIKPINVR
ncbi:MAG: Mur ligase family protein [Spirochaetia bacterium]|nr:Mur ligase family protein [Spirochaetia bacterium]